MHKSRITHNANVVKGPGNSPRDPKAGGMKDNEQMAAKKTIGMTQPAPKLDDKGQLARVRRICNEIPGTVERISHGEPTFFTPKRVFIMFANNHHDDGHLAVWIPAAPGAQEALMEEAPDTYFRPPYVGVGGWVGVELAKVDDEQLGELIRGAFRFVSAKKTASARSKSGSTTEQRG